MSNYNNEKRLELVNGFLHGFDVGYRGPENRRDSAENIPISVGSHVEMWNKLMKEVKLGRVAGPFNEIPFKNYIQSPIGLVPKGENQTRLIFHLSYNFGGADEVNKKSFNHHTPKEYCTVKYKDLDYAIKQCLELQKREDFLGEIFYSKSDLKSAFRLVPLKNSQIKWLCMKAINPRTKVYQYFVDKSLPFGASISCALFTKFSDSLRHLSEYVSGRYTITNYLDDFLFISDSERTCNNMVRSFLNLCQFINCPISADKTEWASQQITFLGVLLDGHRNCIALPEDKVEKAKQKIKEITLKKKATIQQLQSLTGFLNFLNKAIIPGRAFTRRMYAKIPSIAYGKTEQEKSVAKLKKYHHVKLDVEFKGDCSVWLKLLEHHRAVALCRPFTDFSKEKTYVQLNFYTDASLAVEKGFGCVYNDRFTFGQWEPHFISGSKPSIQYVELYALCVGVFTWQEYLTNGNYTIYCDNEAVMNMVNLTTSGCKNCMILIRMLVLNNLRFNRRLEVEHVKSRDNVLADSLSRMDLPRFWRNAPASMNAKPDQLPAELWPVSNIWVK